MHACIYQVHIYVVAWYMCFSVYEIFTQVCDYVCPVHVCNLCFFGSLSLLHNCLLLSKCCGFCCDNPFFSGSLPPSLSPSLPPSLPLQLPTTPTWDDFHLLSRHLRSDSSSSVVGTDEDGTPVVDVRRARARSLR